MPSTYRTNYSTFDNDTKFTYGCASPVRCLFGDRATRSSKLMESLRYGIRYVVLSRRASSTQRYRGEATLESRNRAWSVSVISRRRSQRKWRPVTKRSVPSRSRRNVKTCWRRCSAMKITSIALTVTRKVCLTMGESVLLLLHVLSF